jgi:beta-lactam-binding protein with PASTA domain
MRYLLPLLVAAGLLLSGWLWLNRYTQHSAIALVPDVRGLDTASANDAIEARTLHSIVVDSVYTEGGVPGSVVDQDPPAGAAVKPGRKVYLVLNALQPPMIDMPKLVDLSKRQALSVLEILGLRVASMSYRPDPCVDCVLDQLVEGRRVAAGDRVRRGVAVALVLGSGERGERVPVPDLFGLNGSEVGAVLNMASLNPGLVVTCDGCTTSRDSSFARVYRQSPAVRADAFVSMGSQIDVWLTIDTTGLRPRPVLPDTVTSTTNDTIDAVE